MDLRPLLERSPLRPGAMRLPWHERGFSRRMLAQHLDAGHDRASRRPGLIDAHCAWLASLLPTGPARILDLGCGPGLYLDRLLTSDRRGVGVDLGPAAIDHAERSASAQAGRARFVIGDFRTVEMPMAFDLVLLLYGELNTFEPSEVGSILGRIGRWLGPGGRAVIEVSTQAGVLSRAAASTSWYTSDGGLFSPEPHVVLEEAGWFEADQAAVQRWWPFTATGPAARPVGTTTWWYGSALEDALATAGLTIDARHGDLTGRPPQPDDEYQVLVVSGGGAAR